VKKIVFISSIVPQTVQTAENEGGVPPPIFEGFRAAMEQDRAQLFLDVPTGPFFGFNRPGAKVSQGLIDSWFQQGMQTGIKAAYETTRSWEVDYRDDLRRLDIPALIIQGDDDQIVPIKVGAYAAAELIKGGTLKVYPGGAHGLPNTEVEGINNDLLQFLRP